MSTSAKNTPGLAFLFFLAMAGFGTYLISSGPLESSRPASLGKDVPQLVREGRIPARLWQDPFRLLFERLAAGKGAAAGVGNRLQPLLDEIREGARGELRVLAVMVSTAPYAEVEERRRRRRYAVVSALSEAGFAPVDAGHIQMFVLESPKAAPTSPLPVPFEWYRRSADPRGRVLLLWLDEGAFVSSPVKRLADLIGGLFTHTPPDLRRQIRFNLIGPARSATLRRMAQDLDNGHQADLDRIRRLGLAGLHVVSPTATLPDEHIYAHPERDALQNRFNVARCRQQGETCITFHRLIHDDRVVLSQLLPELNRRGIDKGNCSVDGDCPADAEPGAGIILISELDTDFGRALPEIFKAQFCGDDAACKQRVRHYHFLRGIDGKAANSRDIGLEGAAAGNPDPLATLAEKEMPRIRRPVGPAQYDYLRRLADEIVRLDRLWRTREGRGVQAIGILGSDVYDKLLILRALRPRLTGTLFFTTDLDAALLHPAEYPWTRNLLVSASHGLRLAPDIQTRTPPFRNGYQSAVFHAVRAALAPQVPAALDAAHARVAASLPALFEIGRHGAIRLPGAGGFDPASLTPPPPERHLWRAWTLLAMLSALGLLVFHQWRPRSRTVLIGLAAGSLVILALLALAIVLNEQEEPLYLWSGVSVWPSLVLRLLAILLVVHFVRQALASLERNQDRLTRDWFPSLANDAGPGPDGIVHRDRFVWLGRLIPFAIVAGALTWYFPKLFPHVHIVVPLILWGLLLGLWFAMLRRRFAGHALADWRDGGEAPVSAQDFWRNYLQLGRCRFRFARVLTVTLVFQAFIMSVYLIFGLDHLPVRGEISRVISEVILVSSEFLMLFLLFFSVDASRLAMIFVRRLSRDRFREDEPSASGWPPVLGLPSPLAGEWLRIRLIAERTAVVGMLIYYPFVVIILLVASRIGYFDNWGLPQGLAIIVAATVLVAILAALRLRHEAERARAHILERLEHHHLAVINGAETALDEAQVKHLIRLVTEEREGAFQPFLDQPVVRATLLLLGGVGASVSQLAGLLY